MKNFLVFLLLSMSLSASAQWSASYTISKVVNKKVETAFLRVYATRINDMFINVEYTVKFNGTPFTLLISGWFGNKINKGTGYPIIMYTAKDNGDIPFTGETDFPVGAYNPNWSSFTIWGYASTYENTGEHLDVVQNDCENCPITIRRR